MRALAIRAQCAANSRGQPLPRERFGLAPFPLLRDSPPLWQPKETRKGQGVARFNSLALQIYMLRVVNRWRGLSVFLKRFAAARAPLYATRIDPKRA